MIYEFASIDGGLESVCFTLEGDGPLFFLDNRTLRMASAAIRPFKWEGAGSIVNLNGLRLRVVTGNWSGFDYIRRVGSLHELLEVRVGKDPLGHGGADAGDRRTG